MASGSQPTHSKEVPVFFDETGRRWRNFKRLLVVVLVALVALGAYLIPPALRPVAVSSEQVPAQAAEELARAFYERNVPVLGKGQFIRAVRIGSQGPPAIYEVFSGQYIRDLNEEEIRAASDSNYAIERYGEMPARQLALTFDDGPHPKYTPKLLDMLSQHGIHATFFVVGANVAKYPELAARIVREGHTIANHTYGHIDFDFAGTFQGNQEITQTQRVIRAATGRQTAFMRLPYAGNTDEAQRDNIKGILQAQQLGYVETSFDYDTNDWQFTGNQNPDPSLFDGTGKIMLLHDSGGDRDHTIDYVNKLIPMAKEAGYTFANIEQAYPSGPLQTSITPTLADRTSLVFGQAVLVWPMRLMYWLFGLSVVVTLGITGTNIALAFAARRRQRRPPDVPDTYRPKVTVLVPAYNEAKVLAQSVRSLLASEYKHLTVLIIDDGSTDNTLKVAEQLQAKYDRVRVIHQANRGKAAALNNGLQHSNGEVVISIDADTMFEPHTVGRLVRHFYNPNVGAVAGLVRVGNVRNLLTRWQALEYITSIAIERAAQAFLGAITVVPGACGAWRRAALEAVGGFSDRTLAEDCDVALSIHEAGYTIVQDPSAVGHTECPMTLGDLAKQRFRWIFGNAQSYWKHRNMFFNKRYGWLGSFILPTAALTLLMPLTFWPLLLAITTANLVAGRWWVIALFSLIIIVVQTFVAFIGLRFARESMRHLTAAPLTRLVYSPLRTYILYRSLLTVLRGALVSWNKFKRTSTVTKSVIAPAQAQSSRGARKAAEE